MQKKIFVFTMPCLALVFLPGCRPTRYKEKPHTKVSTVTHETHRISGPMQHHRVKQVKRIASRESGPMHEYAESKDVGSSGKEEYIKV